MKEYPTVLKPTPLPVSVEAYTTGDKQKVIKSSATRINEMREHTEGTNPPT